MRVQPVTVFIAFVGVFACLCSPVLAAPPTYTISGVVATGEGTGVEGVDAFIGEELAQAACGGFVVRIWGDLSTSVADAGGRQIVVRRLEIIHRPTITPVQRIPDGPVDGWAGMIHPECRVSQFDDYFERDDGQRFGVEADNEESSAKVTEACCEELPVKIWGYLFLGEDYDGRRIVVTRIEFVH